LVALAEGVGRSVPVNDFLVPDADDMLICQTGVRTPAGFKRDMESRVYLAELHVANFRKLRDIQLRFRPGLNVVVGANNVGKSALVDALRALLTGPDDPPVRFDVDDRHRALDGSVDAPIDFHYVFRSLEPDDEADFLPALKPTASGEFEVHIHVRYSEPDSAGRLRVSRWCGDHEDVSLTSDMMENLRGVYLQPLRDAAQALRPARNSQLSRLLQLLTDDEGRGGIDLALRELDEALKQYPPLRNAQNAIAMRHSAMLGPQLAQGLEVGLSASDFQRLAARLSLLVDAFEIEQNGLGFNNLIYMAVVLSELARSPSAAFRGLIVEEPEAHLHPQLQGVLLRYLQTLQIADGERPVQLFVTSHSPNFASIAPVDCLVCLVNSNGTTEGFSPGNAVFQPGKREKLQRYLDVTRAELFFARRVIFVEGAAELLLVDTIATREGLNLRQHGISLISVEGLNFDSFLPLFGERALKIPVAVITDADPRGTADEDGEPQPVYPGLGEPISVSANTARMQERQDRYVRVFHGRKTLEYDLALHAANRAVLLDTLEELHPRVAARLRLQLAIISDDATAARILFSGMFERAHNNVQKGRFAQALAQRLAGGTTYVPPAYLLEAIRHVCREAA
jgi:putative ATP-dependent endonuclease of OLD family